MLRFENCENPLLIFSVTNKMAAHFCFLPTIFFWFLFSESLKMILCFSTLNMVNPLFVFIARMPCWGFLFSFFFFFCNHPESFSWPFLNMTLSFYLSVETSPASVCGPQNSGRVLNSLLLVSYKEYSSATARKKRCIGRGVGRILKLPCPLWAHRPPTH